MTKRAVFGIINLPHESGRGYHAPTQDPGRRLCRQRLIIRGKSMYAVIVTGGKQYKVSEGAQTVRSSKSSTPEAGSEVTFDKVLLVADGGKIMAGAPYVEGATVEAKLEKNGKGKKNPVFSSTRQRRKTNAKRSATDSLIPRLP